MHYLQRYNKSSQKRIIKMKIEAEKARMRLFIVLNLLG